MKAPVNHKPSTPLPYEFDPDRGVIRNATQNVANINLRPGAEKDGAFLAHAGNVYQDLVDQVWQLLTMPQNNAAERLRRKDAALTFLRQVGEAPDSFNDILDLPDHLFKAPGESDGGKS